MGRSQKGGQRGGTPAGHCAHHGGQSVGHLAVDKENQKKSLQTNSLDILGIIVTKRQVWRIQYLTQQKVKMEEKLKAKIISQLISCPNSKCPIPLQTGNKILGNGHLRPAPSAVMVMLSSKLYIIPVHCTAGPK